MWDDLQEMVIEKRQCSRCKKRKLLTEFNSDSSRGDGLKSYCKKCNNKARRNCKYRTHKEYLGLPISKEKYYRLTWKYAATHEQIERYSYTTSCDLCGVDLPIGSAMHKHFDHCHVKGMYRGTLCTHCNTALGTIEHDSHGLSPEEWCERALKYLNEPHEE